MYCSKMNQQSCLYYERIVHDIQIRSATWHSGEKTIVKEKGCGFDSPAEKLFAYIFPNDLSGVQIFGKQSYSQNARKVI